MDVPVAFRASPSKIALFEDCPRRYRFKYVLKLPSVPRPWLSFGNSMHAALKELFDLEPDARTWEALERALRANWVRDGYADAEEERRYGIRALDGLKRFFETEPDVRTLPPPRLREHWIEVKVGDVVLNGKVDRVDETPEGLTVVDYKTGEPKAPERASADLAFTIYAILVRGLLRRAPSRFVWHFVEAGEKVVTVREPEALDRALEDVLGMVERIRAEAEFPPITGPGCRFCDYLERCPEGTAVVEATQEG